MLTKIKISESQRKELEKEFENSNVRFVIFSSTTVNGIDNNTVKCYSEGSKLLFEKKSGPLYELAAQLPSNESIMLKEILNASSSE